MSVPLSWMRGELVGASLDHTIWFHRPARADEWLLFATDSPWSGSGRRFNRGRIFNLEGQLVASVAQEGDPETSAMIDASPPA